MKTLHTILAFLFLAGVSFGQTLNNDGLYVAADGTLFSGKTTMMKNDTRVELIVKDGQAEGAAFYYYPSGKLMESGSFTAGQKNDKWVRYNEQGSMTALAFYAAGKKTGTWLVYDDNGNKRFEMNYNDGEKSGVWKNWDETGQVVSTKDYSKVN